MNFNTEYDVSLSTLHNQKLKALQYLLGTFILMDRILIEKLVPNVFQIYVAQVDMDAREWLQNKGSVDYQICE